MGQNKSSVFFNVLSEASVFYLTPLSLKQASQRRINFRGQCPDGWKLYTHLPISSPFPAFLQINDFAGGSPVTLAQAQISSEEIELLT